MSALQETIAALGEWSAAEVVAAWESGKLSREEFIDWASRRLAVINHHGASAGLLALLAALTEAERDDVVPMVPDAVLADLMDTDRLGLALTTATAVTTTASMRLGRLARSEAAQAVQRALGGAMADCDAVEGWSRELEPDHCELCGDWASGGRTFDADVTMLTHTGCMCHPKPTIRPNTDN